MITYKDKNLNNRSFLYLGDVRPIKNNDDLKEHFNLKDKRIIEIRNPIFENLKNWLEKLASTSEPRNKFYS